MENIDDFDGGETQPVTPVYVSPRVFELPAAAWQKPRVTQMPPGAQAALHADDALWFKMRMGWWEDFFARMRAATDLDRSHRDHRYFD